MKYKHEDGREVKAPNRAKAVAMMSGKPKSREWFKDPELAEEYLGKLKGVFTPPQEAGKKRDNGRWLRRVADRRGKRNA